MTPPPEQEVLRRPRRARGWSALGLALLLLLGALYAAAALSDLAATTGGLPADHTGTFGALTGRSFAALRSTDPGAATYITVLERGYAIHELTFATLFLVLIAIPFRRRARWAWWAAWTPTLANIGYTLTFGAHDPGILIRAIAIDAALPVLLLAHLRAFHRHRRPGPTDTTGT